MKRINLILTIILFLMAGCSGNRQSDGGFITIDVTKSYPMKELILQDFADVEYVPLESADEFLNEGWVYFVNNDFIILRNRNDRNAILTFDRHTGKALHRFSRQGGGPEEYNSFSDIVFDEDRKELFVKEVFKPYRILVYNPEGQFKRSFKNPEGTSYGYLYNYDRDHLFSGQGSWDESGQAFHIISKQDGSVVRQIEIPYEKKAKLPAIIPAGYPVGVSAIALIPFKEDFIITELSTDTVYKYSPGQGLQPFIVRTPPIHSMSSPEVYLSPRVMSDRYYFIRMEKMDLSAFTTLESLLQFKMPVKEIVFDTKEKAVYAYKLYNADITNKTEVEFAGRCNGEIIFVQSIDAYKLVEYYKKGELKGRLKEIAATLDEEDNPLIMIAKHRK